jgi:uncharacterized membrane protein YqjE
MPTASRGILGSARAIFTNLVQVVYTRVELAITELQEERERLFPIIVYAVIALVLLGLGFFFLTILVMLIFWETHRLLVLGLFIAAYFLGGIYCAWQLNRHLAERPRLLSATFQELQKDLQGLRG